VFEVRGTDADHLRPHGLEFDPRAHPKQPAKAVVLAQHVRHLFLPRAHVGVLAFEHLDPVLQRRDPPEPAEEAADGPEDLAQPLLEGRQHGGRAAADLVQDAVARAAEVDRDHDERCRDQQHQQQANAPLLIEQANHRWTRWAGPQTSSKVSASRGRARPA
jgi:hypothetical protein